MGARGPEPNSIVLLRDEVAQIEGLLARGTTEQRVATRGRILLLSHQGLGSTAIARRLGLQRQSVARILARYRTIGLDALHDRPRSGRPRAFSPSG